MKKNNKKGFTLAELLVVVGIIAILVAIAIPTFSAATDRATVGVEQANARSAYAEYKLSVIADGTSTKSEFQYDDGKTYKVAKEADGTYSITITGTGVKSSTIDGKSYHYVYGKNDAA